MFNPIREKRLLDIEGADNLTELTSVRQREQYRLATELSTSPAAAVVESLNELHDALIARTIALAEYDLARLGLGAPPVPYTYMLFGSGGRHEQTTYSDQDSCLIYADASDVDEAARYRAYFSRLSEKIVNDLITIQYPPCEGNVISSNAEWCLPLSGWEEKIDRWFAEPGWENVRYLLIVADARRVYGDSALADKAKDRFFGDVLSRPVIAKRMMENTIRHKVLVGVFGQLLTEEYGEDAGSLDVKYGAYIPMVNAFRLLAIQAGIRETSTLGRIERLRQAKLLSDEEAAEYAEAFTLFLKIRLFTATPDDAGRLTASGKIPAEKLTKELRTVLKKALKAGKKIQRRVQREMHDRFGGR
ncbi:DUF294 nucleotidyltransferase-like domain-containing protein [Cohnella suwonensis]|uniref:DUF294 nucleotidyltransferase-like domain-containing protein n=1 Tax=Cohnella suwonensis TaxID=696072 RepID=A0ABW0LVW4_9BACL